MITDRGADTLLTDSPAALRGVWFLSCFWGVFIAIAVAVGVVGIVDGSYVLVVVAVALGLLMVLGLRLTFLRYRITVSDEQVRIQRLFRPLVRPIDVSARHDELLGYYVESYRGVRFAIYKKDGERLGCLVRTYTIKVPEVHEAMARHAIPPSGSRRERARKVEPTSDTPRPTEP